MLITDLPFPITIVAPDGWAEFFERDLDAQSWNSVAIRKYSRIGFVVADAGGSVWDLVSLSPREKLSFFDRLRFQPRRIPTDVKVQEVDGPALDAFRESLRKALLADSDCMTQFCSKEKILSVISGANSVQSLSQQLHKMRVI